MSIGDVNIVFTNIFYTLYFFSFFFQPYVVQSNESYKIIHLITDTIDFVHTTV